MSITNLEKRYRIMNRKLTLDIAIIISAITGAVLSYAYLQDPMERHISLAVLGVFALHLREDIHRFWQG